MQIAAKYLTGQAATWCEGDWDGAPGRVPEDPPCDNGVFDTLDIVAALQSGVYLTGPYATPSAAGGLGDDQTSIIYDPATGEHSADAPADTELTSTNIDSAQNLGGSFDSDADINIFKATFGSSFGSLSFGNVAQAVLSEEFVLGDLTVIGSLAGGGDLGEVDLIYIPRSSAEPVGEFTPESPIRWVFSVLSRSFELGCFGVQIFMGLVSPRKLYQKVSMSPFRLHRRIGPRPACLGGRCDGEGGRGGPLLSSPSRGLPD